MSLRLDPSRFAVALALTLAVREARAQELPRARLEFANGAATERCLDEAQLRQLVAARLGRDPFDERAQITVRVHLARSGASVRATITRLEEHRSSAPRVLLSRRSDCADIGAALGLAVSMTIDPLARTPAPIDPPPASIEPPPARIEPPPARIEPPPARIEPPPAPREAPALVARRPAPAPAPWALYVSVAPAMTLGALAAPSLGPQALLALRYGAFSAAVSGRFDAAWPATFDSFAVHASLASGALRACGALEVARSPRVVIELCALGAAGALAANASMLDQSTPSVALYLAAGAEVATSVRFGRWWGLRAGIEGAATISRARQTIDEQGRERELWLAPPFSLAISAGPALYFL